MFSPASRDFSLIGPFREPRHSEQPDSVGHDRSRAGWVGGVYLGSGPVPGIGRAGAPACFLAPATRSAGRRRPGTRLAGDTGPGGRVGRSRPSGRSGRLRQGRRSMGARPADAWWLARRATAVPLLPWWPVGRC